MQSNQKYCNVSELQILATIKYNVNLSSEKISYQNNTQKVFCECNF